MLNAPYYLKVYMDYPIKRRSDLCNGRHPELIDKALNAERLGQLIEMYWVIR